MRFKSLASPLALVIGLGVTGAAIAQDAAAEAEAAWTIENGAMMINGAELTEEQAGYVQNYCDDLQDEFENDTPGDGAPGSGESSESSGGGETSDEGSQDADSEETEPSLEELPTSMIDFDLSQLTRDDCVEAGFITE